MRKAPIFFSLLTLISKAVESTLTLLTLLVFHFLHCWSIFLMDVLSPFQSPLLFFASNPCRKTPQLLCRCCPLYSSNAVVLYSGFFFYQCKWEQNYVSARATIYIQVRTDALKLGAVVSDICLNESLTAIRPWLLDPLDTANCTCTCTCPAFPLRWWMGQGAL